jgi:hypothetical protein
MQRATAKAAVIEWLDLAIPDQQLHFELVQALYGTPKSILGATIAALGIIAITAFLTNDHAYGWFFLCVVPVRIMRMTASPRSVGSAARLPARGLSPCSSVSSAPTPSLRIRNPTPSCSSTVV